MKKTIVQLSKQMWEDAQVNSNTPIASQGIQESICQISRSSCCSLTILPKQWTPAAAALPILWAVPPNSFSSLEDADDSLVTQNSVSMS